MHITIINDCSCANTRARLTARTALLTDASVLAIGVANYSDLAAAGNLVDALDAHVGKRSAILVNVAPRFGTAKRWENGTPFCFFEYQNVIVVATIEGYTLSLIKKLGIVDHVNVLDVQSSVTKMVSEHLLTQEEGERIVHSQFRSFDFQPRIASYLLHENEPPSTRMNIEEIADVPHAAWWVDNFGNVKTTLLPDDVGFEVGKRAGLSLGEFMCFERLSDVPDDEAGLIIGSSGLGEQRFLELVVQGGSASEHLNMLVGDLLIEEGTGGETK